MLENNDTRKKIEIYLLTILLVTSFLYGCFRAYPLLSGPRIILYNPHDGDKVASTTFEISGKVSHVKEITIQGRPIPIGTDGNFAELLLAQTPYTLIVISATDFYGAKTTKTLRVTPE